MSLAQGDYFELFDISLANGISLLPVILRMGKSTISAKEMPHQGSWRIPLMVLLSSLSTTRLLCSRGKIVIRTFDPLIVNPQISYSLTTSRRSLHLSVRITSKKTWSSGLFIADFAQVPHGCSVWPAYWSVGPNWPTGGKCLFHLE